MQLIFIFGGGFTCAISPIPDRFAATRWAYARTRFSEDFIQYRQEVFQARPEVPNQTHVDCGKKRLLHQVFGDFPACARARELYRRSPCSCTQRPGSSGRLNRWRLPARRLSSVGEPYRLVSQSAFYNSANAAPIFALLSTNRPSFKSILI